MIKVMSAKRKWLLGVPGGLLLSILGNGLWEIAFKPAVQWLATATLTIASLGSSAIKDSIYTQAAKGYHEQSSILIIVFMFVIMSAATVFMILKIMSVRLRWRKDDAEFHREPTSDEITKRLTIQKKRFNRLSTTVIFLLITTAGQFLVISLQITESNDAYTFFSQSLTICRPYIDEHKAQVIQSHFALVRNKQDYVNVIKELQTIAKSNNLPLPHYNPW